MSAKVKDKVAAVEKLKVFMRANPVRGVNIKQLIEDGRHLNLEPHPKGVAGAFGMPKSKKSASLEK